MGIIEKSIFAALAIVAQPASAAVFHDYSPRSAADNGNELVNQAEDKLFRLAGGGTSLEPQQNVLVRFTIANAMTLNGMDIFSRSYGNPNFAVNLARPIGTPVTIKIRADNGGRPADTNLVRLVSTITASSTVFALVTAHHMRVHADFTDTRLNPGTYWIGMSGTDVSVNWTYFFNVDAGIDTYTLRRETVHFPVGLNSSAAFRLHGFETPQAVTPGAVPEPATWAMLIGGFGLTGAAARRRRRSAA